MLVALIKPHFEMKILTFIGLSVLGLVHARPETISVISGNNSDPTIKLVETESELFGRVLYKGSQLWKTIIDEKSKLYILTKLRDDDG